MMFLFKNPPERFTVRRATACLVLLTGRAGDQESKRKAQSVSPEKVGGLSRGESL